VNGKPLKSFSSAVVKKDMFALPYGVAVCNVTNFDMANRSLQRCSFDIIA